MARRMLTRGGHAVNPQYYNEPERIDLTLLAGTLSRAQLVAGYSERAKRKSVETAITDIDASDPETVEKRDCSSKAMPRESYPAASRVL